MQNIAPVSVRRTEPGTTFWPILLVRYRQQAVGPGSKALPPQRRQLEPKHPFPRKRESALYPLQGTVSQAAFPLTRLRAKHGFPYGNNLYSLYSTIIDLYLSVFRWAKFGRTNGAVKLHIGLYHDGIRSSFVSITDGKKHDVTTVPSLNSLQIAL